jgi:hypothetical protein
MKDDIFDDIAKYVPEPHRQPYWRMVAHFRQLKPEDEILNIIFAMGILTFVLRELPAGIIEERKAWEAQFKAFRIEADKIMTGSNRQMVSVSNHVETVNKALEKSSLHLREGVAQIEIVSRECVKRIDIDGMAQRLTARVEERVVTRFDALATTMENRYQLMEKIGEQTSGVIRRLGEIHMGRMIAAISAVILVLCGGAFLAAYWHLQDTNRATLDDQFAQIEQMATANQEAFAVLSVNHIKVDVVDVAYPNGEKQLGEKALRLTPALDVQAETPDGQPKSGMISFNVTPTLQDQMEHSQEEIQRILRAYPTSK